MFNIPTFGSNGHDPESYSPLFFLAALGAGGLAVTFFMVPMFWVPHPDTPIPTFEALATAFQTGPVWLSVVLALCLIGVAVFSAIHVRLLLWNIGNYTRYKRTNAYQALRKSNTEVQLMAIPLTYAMSINVGFILGALFVPGLWSIVEYLFPAAILGFLTVGIYGLSIFGRMMTRVIGQGGFDFEHNNNLSQMLAIFAFSMVAVGLAAPAAMSHTPVTSGLGMVLSVMFLTTAILLAVIKVPLALRAMMQHGISREGAVSLWIIIPILTLMGITLFRLRMGGAHNFGMEISAYGSLAMLSAIIGLQVVFGWFGYAVMKQTGYLETYVRDTEHPEIPAAHTFSLICPGVAFFVLWNFFLNQGLVAAGIMDKFDPVWFAAYVPAVFVLIKTLQVYLHLTQRLGHVSTKTLKEA